MSPIEGLDRAGDRLRRAREALAKAMGEAEAEALRALAAGTPESAVARTLGVDRMTVRKWAGKR